MDDSHLTVECQRVLNEFHGLSAKAQDAIRPWVAEMCQGMADFSNEQRFHEAKKG